MGRRSSTKTLTRMHQSTCQNELGHASSQAPGVSSSELEVLAASSLIPTSSTQMRSGTACSLGSAGPVGFASTDSAAVAGLNCRLVGGSRGLLLQRLRLRQPQAELACQDSHVNP